MKTLKNLQNQVFEAYKIKKVLTFIALISLFSCAKGTIDPLDMQTGLRKADFDKSIIKDRRELKKTKESGQDAPIPQISSFTLSPPKPFSEQDAISGDKTISFFVTEQVSLKDVLIELGRVAKIDVDIDPNINGGIVISARNRPLGEIIDRIATLGNLRYSYKDGILRFERDIPYTKSYFVDYLVEGSNLWGDVQNNIGEIIKNFSISGTTSSTASDGTITTIGIPIQKSNINVNKTAGLISVFATRKQQEEIEKYLKDVQAQASSQVLIEAKVVEVALNDQYKTGINWSASNPSHIKSHESNFKAVTTNGYATGSALDLVIGSSSLFASISALEQFGTTRTLSSPRIHATNNQKATLNFTDKLVYFRVESSQTTTASTVSNTIKTVTSTKLEENVGVELTIIPSINLKTNEITLNIKPKITIKSGEVVDPASPTDSDGKIIAENKVPVIQTRELETIAKIQSGNVIIIGGLMKESTNNVDSGIPYLQRIPLLGYLFKSTSKTSEIVETVIFIKASIINSGSQVGKVDREIEQKFDTNKRNFF